VRSPDATRRLCVVQIRFQLLYLCGQQHAIFRTLAHAYCERGLLVNIVFTREFTRSVVVRLTARPGVRERQFVAD
jgi:hypothetical protein